MKYKVGQEVRISADIHEGMSESPGVTEEMMKLRGMVFTIKEVFADNGHEGGWYSLKNGWSWSEEMLEPVILTSDEAFEQLLHGKITDAQYIQELKKINKGA